MSCAGASAFRVRADAQPGEAVLVIDARSLAPDLRVALPAAWKGVLGPIDLLGRHGEPALIGVPFVVGSPGRGIIATACGVGKR